MALALPPETLPKQAASWQLLFAQPPLHGIQGRSTPALYHDRRERVSSKPGECSHRNNICPPSSPVRKSPGTDQGPWLSVDTHNVLGFAGIRGAAQHRAPPVASVDSSAWSLINPGAGENHQSDERPGIDPSKSGATSGRLARRWTGRLSTAAD